MRRASHVMTQRIRYEVDRAMEEMALYSFVHEFFIDQGPPTLDDMRYVVRWHTYHYVVDSHERIALTAQFAYSASEWPPWRSKPWPERQRRLSQDDIRAVSTAVTRILRKVPRKSLRSDVLYHHVRKEIPYRSWQPLSKKEFREFLEQNMEVFIQDRSGYIHLPEAYSQPAADEGMHGEETQISNNPDDGRRIQPAEPHSQVADSWPAADDGMHGEEMQISINAGDGSRIQSAEQHSQSPAAAAQGGTVIL